MPSAYFAPSPRSNTYLEDREKKQRNRNEMSGAVSEIESSRKNKRNEGFPRKKKKKKIQQKKKISSPVPKVKGLSAGDEFFPFPFLNFSSFFSGETLGSED